MATKITDIKSIVQLIDAELENEEHILCDELFGMFMAARSTCENAMPSPDSEGNPTFFCFLTRELRPGKDDYLVHECRYTNCPL